MLLKIFLIIVSFCFFTGCEEKKVDAFECGLITVDFEKNPMPLENWYWYCFNPKTKQEIRRNIKDSERCIRDVTKKCKFSGTDVLERNRLIEEYKRACQ